MIHRNSLEVCLNQITKYPRNIQTPKQWKQEKLKNKRKNTVSSLFCHWHFPTFLPENRLNLILKKKQKKQLWVYGYN